MNNPRFLQIHTLHSYSGVLLNRDDSGSSKRLIYGGIPRTRISSQCLKRHWRTHKGPHSLASIDGVKASIRSREIVTERIIEPLLELGIDPKVIDLLNEGFQKFIYGDKGVSKKNRQPLLLGEPEINYLAREVSQLAEQHAHDVGGVKKALADWMSTSKSNMKALRKNTQLPGGITAALFGRMVTSDTEANIDAAIHVAHSITVHSEETEFDYFTVVDDLQEFTDDSGASHIGESELTSTLFYGYCVVDIGILLSNLGHDTELSGKIVSKLIKLIATVSPGAKLGSTAPYSYAEWMLIEAGDSQPRSLSGAFRKPTSSLVSDAAKRIDHHLAGFDEVYQTCEARKFICIDKNITCSEAQQSDSLNSLSDWAGQIIMLGE